MYEFIKQADVALTSLAEDSLRLKREIQAYVEGEGDLTFEQLVDRFVIVGNCFEEVRELLMAMHDQSTVFGIKTENGYEIISEEESNVDEEVC